MQERYHLFDQSVRDLLYKKASFTGGIIPGSATVVPASRYQPFWRDDGRYETGIRERGGEYSNKFPESKIGTYFSINPETIAEISFIEFS